MSDLREAAGRLKSDSWDVYHIRPKNEDEWLSLCDKITADGALLADAVLPEFDETAVDDMWLVSVGGERRNGGLVVKLGPLLYSNRDGFSIDESELPITTRGQLRTLCRALGIQLGDGRG